MPGMSMGTDEGLTAAEAAELLDVSVSRVYQMNREGIIHAVGRLRQTLRFSTEEICALAAERQKNESLGLSRMHARLIQLGAQMHTMQRQLESVQRVLGLSLPSIGNDEVEVRSLYIRAQQAVEEPTLNLDDIRKWTQVFLAIHEEFFELVERYTEDPEPWSVFSRLGQKMNKDCPLLRDTQDDELVIAQRELNMARRNVREAAWLYVTNRRGSEVADEVFPETDRNVFRSLLNSHVFHS